MKKNSILLFLFVFSFLACNKDLQNAVAPVPAQTWYPIPEDYRKVIPEHYRDFKTVVFTDAAKREKVLDVTWHEGKHEYQLSDRTVNSEFVSITLTDKEVQTYLLSFSVGTTPVTITTAENPIPQTSMTISMNVSLVCKGIMPGTAIGPVDKQTFPGSYLETVVLNGKTFTEVYKSDDWAKEAGQTFCTEMFYHKKKGFIAFRDDKNVLWVLKE
jgi:hypothetical protein